MKLLLFTVSKNVSFALIEKTFIEFAAAKHLIFALS